MSEWKLAATREARHLMAQSRHDRRDAHDVRRRVTEVREKALRAALARHPRSVAASIERLLRDEDDPNGLLREMLGTVAQRAPRLVDEDTLPALKLLAQANRVGSVGDWKPSGKSRERLFRSLAEHLLALYPMPPFVWSAFFATEDAPALVAVVVHLAAGGSLYQAVKSGLMPVPLTRAMCHELLFRGGEPRFLDAVRRVQVKAAGGDARLFRAWIATRAGRRLHARADEEFWQTVIGWLSANPMLPSAEVGPLVDYIEHRHAESPAFAIKGRSVLAMLRAMREWHGRLAADTAASPYLFPASGFEPMDIDWSRGEDGGPRRTEIWHVREILDRKTLADEGRAMRHCVLSYAPRIQSGESSIWTLTLEDGTGHWRRLTVEVRPSTRRVLQARGPMNRMPEPRELMALDAWTSRNGLRSYGLA